VGTLLRALEFGLQQIYTARFEKSGTWSNNMYVANLAAAKCTCHVGYYSNTQVIANLMHLIVQLSLFSTPPVQDQGVQSGNMLGVKTAGSQAQPDVKHRSCETETSVAEDQGTQTAAVQAIDQCTQAGRAPKPLLPDPVPQATMGVRIGGGYHVVQSPVRATSISLTSYQEHIAEHVANSGHTSYRRSASAPHGRMQQDSPHSRTPATPLAPVADQLAQGLHVSDLHGPSRTLETHRKLDFSEKETYRLISPIRDRLDNAEASNISRSGSDPLYTHYVHGMPSQATTAGRFNMGAYSPKGTLSGKEVSQAIRSGAADKLQMNLYRVLSSEQISPPEISHPQQGAWRRLSESADGRRGGQL